MCNILHRRVQTYAIGYMLIKKPPPKKYILLKKRVDLKVFFLNIKIFT